MARGRMAGGQMAGERMAGQVEVIPADEADGGRAERIRVSAVRSALYEEQ